MKRTRHRLPQDDFAIFLIEWITIRLQQAVKPIKVSSPDAASGILRRSARCPDKADRSGGFRAMREAIGFSWKHPSYSVMSE
jgi:hypothetical protein